MEFAWPFNPLANPFFPDPSLIYLSLLLTAAVAAYLALQHFWLWLGRRHERLHLLVAAFGLDAFVFAAAQAGLHIVSETGTAVVLTRISALAAILVGSLFVATTCTIARTSWRRHTIISVVGVHTAGAILMLRSQLWFTDSGEETPLLLLWLPYLIWVFTVSFFGLLRTPHLSRTERYGLLGALIVYTTSGEYEILRPWIFLPLSIFPYAFLTVAIAFDHMTIRRHNRLFAELEGEVTERTAALRAREAELEDANRQLGERARTDPLTEIGNRLRFREDIEILHTRADAGDGGYGLAMFDVDHFKGYNDSLGHPAGDAVLVSVARAFANGCRAQDRAYRFGGEEFVVLLPGADEDEAVSVAEQLKLAVERLSIPHPAARDVVTVSGGVYVRQPGAGLSAHEVVVSADQALYEAKAAGRNCIKVTPGPPLSRAA